MFLSLARCLTFFIMENVLENKKVRKVWTFNASRIINKFNDASKFGDNKEATRQSLTSKLSSALLKLAMSRWNIKQIFPKDFQ